MEWGDRLETRIGDMGEALVREYFEGCGYILYMPETQGPHPFDRLAIKKQDNSVIIVEVKTKPRRKYYPDTGFNIKHYDKYKEVSEKHNLDVFVVFVDTHEKKMYGNYLSILDEDRNGYPKKQNGIIYFPLSEMITLKELPDYLCELLMNLSDRNYDYK